MIPMGFFPKLAKEFQFHLQLKRNYQVEPKREQAVSMVKHGPRRPKACETRPEFLPWRHGSGMDKRWTEIPNTDVQVR